MPTLHLLGTGAAISDPHRTTTMLAVSDDEADDSDVLLVDCGGDVLQRMLMAGLSFDRLAGLIVTHAHPDHVSGFPLFMEKIWLAGRHQPIPVCGIEPALEQARKTFDAFSTITDGWDDMPPIDWRPVDYAMDATVWDDATWTVTAAPVEHGIPNVGLRIQSNRSGGTVGYSCDTAPSGNVAYLGRDADWLVHEANGTGEGHSSAPQAARIAKQAQANRLLLVHLPPGNKQDDLIDAQSIFDATELGEEGGAYPL
jgi:ribonuclease Z